MKTFIKKLIICPFILITAAVAKVSASQIDDAQATERFGFYVKDLKICHQKEIRNMTVTLEYEADLNGQAMNIQSVRNHVRKFLEDYSNPDDFWEVMNVKLVHSLTATFRDIRALKSKLSLASDATLNFPRESVVQYEKGKANLKESFSFLKKNYLICNETFKSLDLCIDFDIKDNPKRFDYPDYLWIDEALENFFKENPISLSNWKILKPKLQSFILRKFPTLTDVRITVTVSK